MQFRVSLYNVKLHFLRTMTVLSFFLINKSVNPFLVALPLYFQLIKLIICKLQRLIPRPLFQVHLNNAFLKYCLSYLRVVVVEAVPCILKLSHWDIILKYPFPNYSFQLQLRLPFQYYVYLSKGASYLAFHFYEALHIFDWS